MATAASDLEHLLGRAQIRHILVQEDLFPLRPNLSRAVSVNARVARHSAITAIQNLRRDVEASNDAGCRALGGSWTGNDMRVKADLLRFHPKADLAAEDGPYDLTLSRQRQNFLLEIQGSDNSPITVAIEGRDLRARMSCNFTDFLEMETARGPKYLGATALLKFDELRHQYHGEDARWLQSEIREKGGFFTGPALARSLFTLLSVYSSSDTAPAPVASQAHPKQPAQHARTLAKGRVP
jgi:hypothetical protein